MNLTKILFLCFGFGTFSYGTNPATDHEPFKESSYLTKINIKKQKERYDAYKKHMRQYRKLTIGKREREESVEDTYQRYQSENHDGPSGLTPPPFQLPPSDIDTVNVLRRLDFASIQEEQLEQECEQLEITEPSHDYCVIKKESLLFGK